jgi:excisionase family DNA binding protein
MSQFVTVSQAMGILNISRPTIHRKMKTGEIPSVRIGKRVLIPDEFFQLLKNKAMGKIPQPAGK